MVNRHGANGEAQAKGRIVVMAQEVEEHGTSSEQVSEAPVLIREDIAPLTQEGIVHLPKIMAQPRAHCFRKQIVEAQPLRGGADVRGAGAYGSGGRHHAHARDRGLGGAAALQAGGRWYSCQALRLPAVQQALLRAWADTPFCRRGGLQIFANEPSR